jgi:DNA-binding MarR family transcriptional regulator
MEVALAEFGLTPAQLLMLFRMRDHGELSSAALARDIGVRPQSMIGLIRPLERKGFLEREPSPEHQRVLHMRLTPEGKKLVANALRVAGRIESDLLADLSDKEIGSLQDVLTKIWQRAEGHELHPGSIRAKAERFLRERLATTQRRGSRSGARDVTRRG